jgi:hypothetical protein
MKKGMEDPDRKKKEAEKKDRRTKKEKNEEGLKIKLGFEVDLEEPKVVKRPPRRGGCVSGSAGVGLAGNAQISIHPAIEIEPGGRTKPPSGEEIGLHDYVLVAARDIPKGDIVTKYDVRMIERAKIGRGQAIVQVIGRQATRNIRQGVVFKKGMVR